MPIGPAIGLGTAIASGPGSAGNPQLFEYTATGSEGASFTITLPSVRASSSYGVLITGETAGNTLAFSYGTKTTSNFVCRTSAQLVAGTKLTILVEDLR